MKHLDQLRDELAARHTKLCSKQMLPGSWLDGWNALLSHLTDAAGEFDPVALKQAFTQASPGEIAIEPLYRWGARWQFEQDRARIAYAERPTNYIPKNIHAEIIRKLKAQIKQLEARLQESERRALFHLNSARESHNKLTAALERCKELEVEVRVCTNTIFRLEAKLKAQL